MAPTVDQRPETRSLLVLNSRETFSEDLGSFGEEGSAAPWWLRRLLVAWKRAGALAFPVAVSRAAEPGAYTVVLGVAGDARRLTPRRQTPDSVDVVAEVDGATTVHRVTPEAVALDAGGAAPRRIDLSTDYDIDLAAWAAEQGRLAREEGVNALDLPNVAEELESLGRSQENARDSQLVRLLHHLLKWQSQPRRRTRSWRLTILDSRRQLARIARKSPSLALRPGRPEASAEAVADCYADARGYAATETGLPLETFPEDCPWTIAQILDDDFLPETRAR
ncbi:MAG: DUF29 domain-containing protein [Azospirillaceae bacterium]